MKRSNGAEAENKKFQAAMAVFMKQIGGTGDAEDYRATGATPSAQRPVLSMPADRSGRPLPRT